MNKRIGVYICHCGSNISDTIDIETVSKAIAETEGVESVKDVMFACADSAQQEIVEDVQENKLDGIVVASCSPKLHLYTFRAVTERAGLNFNHYVQVNIREQGSWAHSDKPVEATQKAISLIRAGIAKVKLAKELFPLSIPAQDSVLVIGAGIAGLKAALELGNMGLYVHLIEQEHTTGGMTNKWHNVYPTGQKGSDITRELEHQVKNHEKIRFHSGTRLISKTGSVGNFMVTLRKEPTYIEGESDLEDLIKAIDVCPVEIPDQHSFYLRKRKAMYMASQNNGSSVAAVDMENCTKCGDCLDVCKEINLEMKPVDEPLKVGAILLCTGSKVYQPEEGEYGWQESDNILTLAQFKLLLNESNGQLKYNGRKIKNIAYIYCVGVMKDDGDHTYCSRFCCTAAIHTAILAKDKYSDINNIHINKGIRTYGQQEKYYHQASEQGDVFIQWADDEPPEVMVEDGKTIVKVQDILTKGREFEIEPDLVVLVTGMTANPNQEVNDILKVPIGRDGFYNEVHPKLRPVETVLDGILIAGAGQGPKNISESVKSSLSAAAKINALLGARVIQLDPIQAWVNTNDCTWCGECEKACPFDAIEKVQFDGKTVAKIIESNCKGCGMCLPVCPENAIDLTNFSDAEMETMIDALAD